MPVGMTELATDGAVVGELFAHIIGFQFQRIKEGDRFWHETGDKKIMFSNGQ